jgi:hypothetical protein
VPTTQTYPTADDMAQRWSNLAQAIVADQGAPPAPCDQPGSLVVLGSGISHIDLTADTEAEIRSADYVFYCLYDRLSQIWINGLRPDAYDLAALYTEEGDRYGTYLRMAEALLYHVRRGAKVVAIYYGHPGVFAMPAHRAIGIARSEGHQARMRPGISALDYLVADLGFDPALPGLLTFEATDLLLRRRRIDTSLHLVLWQVGVVGEFGFNPKGFENHGFDLLLDELEIAYGAEWPVTHYIAAQYVGIPPLIEKTQIGQLREPEARRRIGALSTFYIEPLVAVGTDPDRAERLGLTKPGEQPPPPDRLYVNFGYSDLERDALQAFERFALSPAYAVPGPTAEADFIFALGRDPKLQARFREDPLSLAEDPLFASLPERSRRLLSLSHPWAVTTAMMEGTPTPKTTSISFK